MFGWDCKYCECELNPLEGVSLNKRGRHAAQRAMEHFAERLARWPIFCNAMMARRVFPTFPYYIRVYVKLHCLIVGMVMDALRFCLKINLLAAL